MNLMAMSRLLFCCLLASGTAFAQGSPVATSPGSADPAPDASPQPRSEPSPGASLASGAELPLQATLSIMPENPEVAAPFVLTLSVRAPRGTIVQLPGSSAAIYPFDVLSYSSSETAEDDSIRVEGRYSLLGLVPGSQQLGPFQVGLKLSDGTEQRVLAAPLSFELRSLLAGRAEPLKDILPIKGPLPPPEPRRGSPWLLAASLATALLLVIVAGTWLRRRASRRRPPPEPAHLVALRRLQELGRRELDSPDSVEPFYVGLSEILRRYLESAFGVPVMEQTTQEIKRAFDPSAHGPSWTFRLYQLLERMDLVKFARFRISASAAFEDLQVARALVEELVEREARAAEESARSQKLDAAGTPAPGGGS